MLAALVGIVVGVRCGAHGAPRRDGIGLPVRPPVLPNRAPSAASEVRQPEQPRKRCRAPPTPAAARTRGGRGARRRARWRPRPSRRARRRPGARWPGRAPSPAAAARCAPRKKRSKSCPSSSSGAPGPWSRTSSTPPRRRTSTSAARRAVRRGVVEDVVDRAAEAVGDAGDDARLEIGAEAHARGMAPRPRDGLGHELVQRDVLDRRVALVAAGQLDEVAHEPAELLGLARPCRAAARAARPPRARRRRAGPPCWSAATVTGVRSSCDASATSRRWAACEAWTRSSMASKRWAIRPDLVLAARADAPPQVARRLDVLGRARELADGPDDRAREQPRHRRGEGGAGDHEQREHDPQAPEDGVDALQRAAELHGAQRPRSAR